MTTSRHKTRTRLDPAVRRNQITEAAARLFAEREPSEVSLEAVAEAAGVSRSLVYSYFGDRGNLFAAAYVHELSRLDAQIDAAMEAPGTDREHLERAIRAYLDFARRHRQAWQLIASGSGSRHPAVRQAITARTQRIATALGDSPETRLLVRAMMGMLEATAAHILEREDLEPDFPAALLTQVIWTGLSSLEPDD